MDGVHVLVLVDDEVADLAGDECLHGLVLMQLGHRSAHDLGEVQIALLVQVGAVLLERLECSAPLEGGRVHIRLADRIQDLEVQSGLDPSLEAESAESCLGRSAVDQQARLHLVQDRVLEVLRKVSLEKLQAVAVDCPDVHLCHAEHFAEPISDAADYAVLEFGAGLLRERERHDVARLNALVGLLAQNLDHPLSDDLRLAGTCTGDDLEVVANRPDRFCLGFCVRDRHR